jgi:hypothetical protein
VFFAMAIQVRWTQPHAGTHKPVVMIGRPEGRSCGARLIQAALALYLIPALLVVLAVGGACMLILAVARIVTAIVSGPGRWPRGPVGPSSHS